MAQPRTAGVESRFLGGFPSGPLKISFHCFKKTQWFSPRGPAADPFLSFLKTFSFMTNSTVFSRNSGSDDPRLAEAVVALCSSPLSCWVMLHRLDCSGDWAARLWLQNRWPPCFYERTCRYNLLAGTGKLSQRWTSKLRLNITSRLVSVLEMLTSVVSTEIKIIWSCDSQERIPDMICYFEVLRIWETLGSCGIERLLD